MEIEQQVLGHSEQFQTALRLCLVDAADRIGTEAREGHEEIKFKQGIAEFVDHAG
jgi:hypothetical protein